MEFSYVERKVISMDLLYPLAAAVFFGVSWALVKLCEYLRGGPP
jgi:hypothetical protein